MLLTPDKARHRRNNIVFERSRRVKFGDQVLMQFLEGRRIFAGEERGGGIAPVFEGRVNSPYSFHHGTLRTPRERNTQNRTR